MEDKEFLMRLKTLKAWQKYALFFIVAHWIMFFIMVYVIEGRVPTALVLAELPSLIILLAVYFFFETTLLIFIENSWIIDSISIVFFVFTSTCMYGLFGTITGLIVGGLRKR